MNLPFARAAFAILLSVLAGAGRCDDASDLTYNRDVAPLFQRHCQGCHHAGTVAPMSLLTYEEVRPWVKSIRKAVVDGEMPPWHADERYGAFKNDRRLPAAERETVLRWIEGGAAAGDPGDHPPPMVFAEGWMIGEPDAVLELPELTIAAEKADEFVSIDLATNFDERKFVKAVEFRPGNAEVVHHIVTSALGTFAPGRQPGDFPPGVALLIEPGETIKVQMHYHKEPGAEAKDQSRIGLRFAREPIHKQLRMEGAFNPGIRIPPGEADYASKAEYRVRRDLHLAGLKPHMHLRGKSMTYTAAYPDGRREILLSVPNYDYEWQEYYEFAEPPAMPAGTVIEVEAHHDNSAGNPNNPDPTVEVRNGELTTDEMMIGWVFTTDDEEDIAAGKLVEAPFRWGRGAARTAASAGAAR